MSNNKSKQSSGKTKEDDTMATLANNFVYEIKVSKDSKEEKPVSKTFIALCKEVSKKYPKKQ